MLQTINITEYQFTIALMLFLVAYSLFEAPSNLALKILSPNRWLGFLTVAFGSFCMGIGGVTNSEGVMALRFFLGAAEAGIFPGLIYYFTFWYSPAERAARIAAFLCCATLSGAFGGCIAYGVGHMNMVGGLEGWRWLFILEGLPSSEFHSDIAFVPEFQCFIPCYWRYQYPGCPFEWLVCRNQPHMLTRPFT